MADTEKIGTVWSARAAVEEHKIGLIERIIGRALTLGGDAEGELTFGDLREDVRELLTFVLGREPTEAEVTRCVY